MSTPTFTRYLYIQAEVEISLLISILKKKNDEALFWAFELVYSGFSAELITLLWRIYFEFFATLNQSFEAYFLKKRQEINTDIPDTVYLFVANIVNNLCRRKYNTDVFLLREIAFNFEMEQPYPLLKDCLETSNYEAISHYIIEVGKDDDPTTIDRLQEIASTAAIYFKEKGLKEKPLQNWQEVDEKAISRLHPKIVLLVRIMQHFMQLHKEIKQTKNLYLNAELEDLIVYGTLEASCDFRPRKILDFAAIYSPEVSYLNIFKSKRLENIMECFTHKWLYYGARSPVWEERILEYDGRLDHKIMDVIFDDDDNMEAFYERFGLEPDEQSIKIVEKIIPPIVPENNVTWLTFYKNFNNPSLSLYVPGQEELEEL